MRGAPTSRAAGLGWARLGSAGLGWGWIAAPFRRLAGAVGRGGSKAMASAARQLGVALELRPSLRGRRFATRPWAAVAIASQRVQSMGQEPGAALLLRAGQESAAVVRIGLPKGPGRCRCTKAAPPSSGRRSGARPVTPGGHHSERCVSFDIGSDSIECLCVHCVIVSCHVAHRIRQKTCKPAQRTTTSRVKVGTTEIMWKEREYHIRLSAHTREALIGAARISHDAFRDEVTVSPSPLFSLLLVVFPLFLSLTAGARRLVHCMSSNTRKSASTVAATCCRSSTPLGPA